MEQLNAAPVSEEEIARGLSEVQVVAILQRALVAKAAQWDELSSQLMKTARMGRVGAKGRKCAAQATVLTACAKDIRDISVGLSRVCFKEPTTDENDSGNERERSMAAGGDVHAEPAGGDPTGEPVRGDAGVRGSSGDGVLAAD